MNILSDMKPYRFLVAASLFLCLPQLAASQYIPVLTGDAIDIISGAQGALTNILIMIGVCTVVGALTQYGISLINNKIAYAIAFDLRAEIFRRIQKIPFSYLDSHGHEEIAAKAVTDVEAYTDGMLLGFSRLFTGVLTIIFTVIMMFTINAAAALTAAAIIPVCIIASGIIAKKTFHNSKKSAALRGSLFSLAGELCGNAAAVKALSYEDRAAKRFAKENETFRRQHVKTLFLTSMANPFTRLLTNISFAVVCGLCAYFTMKGSLSVGAFTAMLIYAVRLGKPVTEITAVFTEFTAAAAAAVRVHELISLDGEASKGEISETKGLLPMDGTSDVRFENVSFSYHKTKPFLCNLSLDVFSGMRVAVVGPTGSGKTTLMNLLMRFYEADNGRIYLNNTDIKNISHNVLRTNVGIVLQDIWLSGGTVFENIAYGKADATPEEVKRAAVAAQADGFISQMSEGYDTVIDESGVNLSEGQKQLLCIARTMLRNPKLLILDEATGYVDTLTEQYINRALFNLTENKTVFTVAHRLSTILDADLILVMEKGNVTEKGTHEQLMAKGGFYYELVNASN